MGLHFDNEWNYCSVSACAPQWNALWFPVERFSLKEKQVPTYHLFVCGIIFAAYFRRRRRKKREAEKAALRAMGLKTAQMEFEDMRHYMIDAFKDRTMSIEAWREIAKIACATDDRLREYGELPSGYGNENFALLVIRQIGRSRSF
jgi:hypothetical protein